MNTKQIKYCNSCKQTLPIARFSIRHVTKNGQQKRKGWHSQCRTCRHKHDKLREKLKRQELKALKLLQATPTPLSDLFNPWRIKKSSLRNRSKQCSICKTIYPKGSEHFKRLTTGRWSHACDQCFFLQSSKLPALLPLLCRTKDMLLLERALRFAANATFSITKQNKQKTIFSVGIILNRLIEQNFHCAICQQDKILVLDHNHNTNVFRGLLCADCNLGLGIFKDNVQFLEAAQQYLITRG